ncbi:MAG: PriCT-2 domain-containing protein [Candidatus Kuenenia sp.]|nr:PriCT-2 domain-containing protein [Candidatus Kuenenia sp.]
MPGRQVSIYKDVLDTIGKPVELSKILNAIKSGHWGKTIEKLRGITEEKEQKAFKNTLPCFTPSGVFNTRTVDELKEHSGILVIDIDAKENPGLLNECNEIRQHLIEDRYTYFLFDSCRGSGLAIGVLIDKSRHIDTFDFLENYYKQKHGLNIDKGCKDVSRLRFVSQDTQLYLNAKAETVKVPVIEHVLTNYDKIKSIVASGKMLGDDTYESWLQQGFALANEFGEDGRSFYHALSQKSGKYNQLDCDKKYDNCIKTNKGAYTFATIMHLAKQAGVTFNGKITIPAKKEPVNLAEEIREWIEETHGDFDYKSCDFDLDLKSKGEKTNRRLVFHRMKKDNKIVGVRGKNGWFRKVESKIVWTDYANVIPSSLSLAMPLGISDIVKFSPGSIIIITGDTNAGKTSFFLNIVKNNNHKFFYFNLEMSTERFRERLDDYGLPIEFWLDKLKMSERGDNIADAIQPNGINIVDYLQCNWETPWTTSIKIDEIFDKLDQGIAIIGLQKKREQSIPRGGEGTLERAQFALALHFNSGSQFQTAEILKAKMPATKFNPNFCICDFKYGENYTDIVKINNWRRK